ncbi:MAG: GH-E family nuclease [Pirellulaceae bacterium]
MRDQYLGGTPRKNSKTGRQVQARMKESGDLRVKNGVTQIRYTAPGATRGTWHDLDETVDMAHLVDAVTWWNSTGYKFGEKSKEVREWMLNPDNYVLQPQSINRSQGARIGKTYIAPPKSDV